MKATVLIISSIMSIFVLTGCVKEPLDNLSQDEARIYITNRSDSANFSSYSTFSVVDSVAIIRNNQLLRKSLTDLDVAYINAVKQQMQARGYTLVSHSAHPDLGINISRVYNTYTGVFSYNDYWGYYGGFWDPWYWGYPGYGYFFPPLYGVYQITDGAVTIDMIDLKNTKAKELKVIWNGLIRGSGTFYTDKAAVSVEALFAQSTYIKAN